MTDAEQRAAARDFAANWEGRGYEKGDSQPFWIALLRDVYGVEHPERFIFFEEQVHIDHTSFIDGMIPSTQVMIEQKSIDKHLDSPIRQSDGSMLTPFQQAKRYITELPVDEHPRWVVTCNFSEFWIYNMNDPQGAPEIIKLENLERDYHQLLFLVDAHIERIKHETAVSVAAGELVGELYDAFIQQYRDPTSERALRSLNILCVRLVFCLYAEDAGIFRKDWFYRYMIGYSTNQLRRALSDLFTVLNTPENNREDYLGDENPILAAFPYVNGGLFSEENIEIPPFTDKIRDLLLEKASAEFDWSSISPTIFGAVFESTLNPDTRRESGMHYTSIDNIHKVIEPLFLTALQREFESIRNIQAHTKRERTNKNNNLKSFQRKLASLKFLDPACGSGNFLTETYLSLRRLENAVLFELTQGQMSFGDENWSPIQVSIEQFYGIEINDFAVKVAQTALWIAESQMMNETRVIVILNQEFLPLRSNNNIVKGNALQINWADIIPQRELSYIMGNPPFIGHQWRTPSQVEDLRIAFHDLERHGKLDYVCGWYNKAADYMQGTHIKAAFVSTNSICQGESVGILWDFLFNYKNVEIQFAYRSFVWSSEASNQAAVHCVIIGFSCYHIDSNKLLVENDSAYSVNHINGYLIPAPDIFIQSRGKPLTPGFPKMSKGSQPTDGGNLILTQEEKDTLIADFPGSEQFIKLYIGAEEFINQRLRYCLWLKDVNPEAYRHNRIIRARLQNVRTFRENSPTPSVREAAENPSVFSQIRQPSTNYLAVPEVSSENRRYIPIGFLTPDIIASNKLYLVPNADLYMFGMLISNVHMAWVRAVAGRLEMRYSYSPAVYNNFPWPNPTDAQRNRIAYTAQAILDVREAFPTSSLADLYDDLAMPPALRRAHQENDMAVMAAFGFERGTPPYSSEAACLAVLMELYRELVARTQQQQ